MSFESSHRMKDGHLLPVDVTENYVNINGQEFNFSFSRDITERKRIEEKNVQLAAIVENSVDAIYSRTLEGTITSWNYGAEKMLGYTAAEAIGKSAAIMLPSNRPQYRQDNNEAVLRGEVLMRESNRITKEGHIIRVLSSHSPIKNAAGAITGLSVILRDITDLKRIQAALQESEARFRLTFDQAAVGMVLVGLDQRYIVANQKFADMTGYARAELQGMAISIIGYADDVAMGMAQRQQLLDGSIDSVTAERRFKRKDGSVF